MTTPRSQSPAGLPPALPAFVHINRYWDPTNKIFAAKILPGEYYITTQGEMITTLLGSCVSACIRDPRSGVGGMNHFMLPDYVDGGCKEWGITKENAGTRYGTFAMEHLINDLLRQGARQKDLEVKVFGGGRVLQLQFDVAERNIEFVESYCRSRGICIQAKDLGGGSPRKIQYLPTTGQVFVKKLRLKNRTIITREEHYLDVLHHTNLDRDPF